MDEWVVKTTKRKKLLVLCMEATGVYHEKLCFIFSERKYNTSIILPNKAKHYLISLGLKSKMTVSMQEVCQNGSRTMFRVMETNG
jgi:transposase